ncbi:odorant receptor 63a-like [Rhagoletis pomonella]|uniref:odorant receptor 63a-like n=1 Tax=Rhagoletis pomonella TaxID=28610 RepID=UPI00177BF738|nr:odorant receptor 63a-like [Rhagoletis pomonella]
MIQQAQGHIPLIAETVTTTLQTTTAIVKLIYFIFMQHRFSVILHKAETHELLQCLEIFKTDMPVKMKLKQEINAIMVTTWLESRRQLIYCVILIVCILSNYFFYAIFINLYHQIQGTPDYVYILPFTGYPMFLDKGMNSFYYALDMFLGACSLHVAGMCAISFNCAFMVFCKHACGIVRVLSLMLQHSTSPLVPAERRVEYLRYCIIQHQRIVNFLDEVNQLFKHIILSQFFHSMAIYGLVLYEINFSLESSKVTLIRMIFYICAAFSGDCMLYVNGQFLVTELEAIPLSCYGCDWYNESAEFKKTLQMIIMRSNKEFCFQISWFGVLSLVTLMGVS